MKGIDISEHNGNIDFLKVKQSGIDFVIIRIGWIGNKENHTVDKKFEEYYTQAKYAGLKIGVYVYSYCTSIETVKEGANWTIQRLQGKTLDYPVFIDMEDNTTIKCGKENLTNQAIEFCKQIELGGKKAGIYANLNWFNNYLDVSKLITYKIWLAQYTTSSNHSAKFKVDLWQYTSNGQVLRNK